MPRSKVGDMMKSKTFDVFYCDIVNNIEHQKVDKKVTQEDMAKAMFTRQPVVSIKLKGEKTRLSIEDLFNLSLLFKCSVEDLIASKEKAPDYRK